MNSPVAETLTLDADPDRVCRRRVESIEIELDPDDRMNQFEVGLSKNEACALIRGDVPPAVQDFLISLVVGSSETPAEAVASMRRRARRSKNNAA